ncbi:hypothetical protein SDC9_56469 [bioreactor metagenome]|uniref:Stage III sporulation protein AD n=1 Tax=bioreactor metagenome TaxID=1076179 RepID=A0A644X7M1_9ZZZZ
MDITKIAALALVAAALAVLLRQYRPELSFSVGLIVTVAVFAAITPYLKASLDFIHTVAEQSGAALPITPVIKALGIAFIAAVAADTCRDAGESAMASRVELASKVAILTLALPLAGELMGLFIRILG